MGPLLTWKTNINLSLARKHFIWIYQTTFNSINLKGRFFPLIINSFLLWCFFFKWKIRFKGFQSPKVRKTFLLNQCMWFSLYHRTYRKIYYFFQYPRLIKSSKGWSSLFLHFPMNGHCFNYKQFVFKTTLFTIMFCIMRDKIMENNVATIRISKNILMNVEGILNSIQFIFQQSLLSFQMNQDHPFMKA